MVYHDPGSGFTSMKIPVLVLAAFVLGVCPSWVVRPAMASTEPMVLPLAQGLMGRYVQALGGRMVLWQLNSFAASGSIGLKDQPATGRLELAFATRDRMNIRLDLGELGSSEVGSDGQLAWEITRFEDLETAELIDRSTARRRRRELNLFELAVRLNENARTFRTVGPAEFHGHLCWEIQKINRLGLEDRIFIDRTSHLLRGIRMTETGPLGEYEITMAFDDWKQVDTLTLFHRVEITQDALTMQFIFEDIRLDSVPAGTFGRPQIIRDLLSRDDADDASPPPADGTSP